MIYIDLYESTGDRKGKRKINQIWFLNHIWFFKRKGVEGGKERS